MTSEPVPGWMLIRPDATIAAADQTARALLGAPSAEALTGVPWTGLVAPFDAAAAFDADERRSLGAAWRGVLRFRAGTREAALSVDLVPVDDPGRMAVLRLSPPPPEPSARATAPSLPADAPAARATALEALSDIDDVRLAARSALQALSEEVLFDWAVVLRFEVYGERVGAEVVSVYPSAIAGIAPGARFAEAGPAEAAVLASGEPAIAADLVPESLDGSPLRRLAAFGMRSRLHLPLFSTTGPPSGDGGGVVVGCAIFYHHAPGAFGPSEGLRAERVIGRLGNRLLMLPVTEGARRGIVSPSALGPGGEPPEQTGPPATAGGLEGEQRLSALGEVVAGVAHELNNPLTAILGYTQLLSALNDVEREQAVHTIEQEAQRAARIVRNLLAFARRGGRRVQPVDVDLLLRRVAEARRYSMEVEHIRLALHLAPVPSILADEARLEEVFLNLLKNAQEALSERGGGEITLSTAVAGDRVRITVADNGPGVPDELRARIFEPFFTTREVGQGQGMGLATVYGVVSEHAGRVWVEPTAGGGATFIVELPAVGDSEGSAARPTVAAPEAEPRALRVLVVDDEAPIRSLTREILGSAGFIVDTAANGSEALRLIESDAYDLVIADLWMPELEGAGLLAEIERRRPELRERVLFIAGNGDGGEERPKARYLEKPFHTNALLRAVSDTLGDAEGDGAGGPA